MPTSSAITPRFLHLRTLVLFLLWFAVVSSFAQTVYVPGGTGGIGASSNANVGIGTASPDEKLSVAGNLSLGGGYLALRDSIGGTAYSLLQTVSNDFNLRVYGSNGWLDAVRIDGDSGRIGLNVTNPGQSLHVWGLNGLPNTSGTSVDGVARFGSGVTNLVLDVGVSGGGDAVAWLQSRDQTSFGYNYRLSLNPNGGNVGIGTTGPNGKLTIDAAAGSVPADGLVRIGNTDYSSQTNNIMLSVAPGVVNVDAPGIVGGRFKIDAAGNVGIGTINPSARLHLKGVGAATQLFIEDANLSTNWQIGTNTGAGGNTHTFSIYSNEFGPSNSYLPLLQLTATNGSILLAPGLGNVGIGTANPTSKLAVNGTVRAKEVIVDIGWSDWVFDEDYQLAPLSEVEAHIKEKKHLPGIPSAAEVEAGGVSLGDMQARMMAKIEELTLHLIAQQKQLNEQQQEIARLRSALTRTSNQQSP